jgi:hypothetical protein
MKLKKYNEYVKEELTPMVGELESETENLPTVDSNDTNAIEVEPVENTDMVHGEEEEGHEVDSWNGDKLLQQFAEMIGSEVVNNEVNVNGQVVTFAPETNTFLINRKNTKISEPHELVHKEFKGHEHNH